jgi:hypothetical protein
MIFSYIHIHYIKLFYYIYLASYTVLLLKLYIYIYIYIDLFYIYKQYISIYDILIFIKAVEPPNYILKQIKIREINARNY